MANDIYRQLQQRLDHYSIGFPATESGIDLKILRKLFSTEDAAMFLSMTVVQIARSISENGDILAEGYNAEQGKYQPLLIEASPRRAAGKALATLVQMK